MDEDVILRDSAQKLLHILLKAADRRGQPGTVKAAKLARELEKILSESGSVADLKKAMLAGINHLTKDGYANEEEFQELSAMFDFLPDDLKQRFKDGEETADKKKTALTLTDMQEYLNSEAKVSISYNEVTREFENGGINPDSLTTKAYSDLVNRYSRVTPDIIERYCAYISRENTYNPVLDKIKGIVWDKVDRIAELCEVLRIAADDELSRKLVRTWCCQTIALINNKEDKPIAGQGILILQTPQDAGKSTLVRKLAFDDPDLYTDAGLKVGDRDSVARITSKWLAELSEIGNIFRSNDPDALKQFLTSPKDQFRVPYGRHDETHARRVSFIGTLNPKGGDRRYLSDDGGDRRYWTVLCQVNEGERFDIERENQIDMAQLWRQAFELVQTEGEKAYRLTKDETNMLIARNREYMKPIAAEAELRDIIEQSFRKDHHGKPKYKLSFLTVTEIKKIYSDELKTFSAEKIGAALKRLGYVQDRRRRYQFPVPVFTSLSVDGSAEDAEEDAQL